MKEKEYAPLVVTQVEVHVFNDGVFKSKMKGLAKVVINDQIVLRCLRITEGANGLYVGYPNDPFYRGEEYMTLFFPTTRQLREHIEEVVLSEYHRITVEKRSVI